MTSALEFASHRSFPRIEIASTGLVAIKRDFKAMLELTGEDVREEWSAIEGIITTMTEGVDPGRPILLELIYADPVQWAVSVPVSNLKQFRDGLDLLGVPSRPDDVTTFGNDRYVLSGEVDGWMKFANGYVLITTEKEEMKSWPDRFKVTLDSVLQNTAKYNFGIRLINTKTDASALGTRRTSFAKLFGDSVLQSPQVAERLRTLYVEASNVTVAGKLLPDNGNMEIAWQLDAISETGFQDQLLQFDPSEFGQTIKTFLQLIRVCEFKETAIPLVRQSVSLNGNSVSGKASVPTDVVRRLFGEQLAEFSRRNLTLDGN